MQRGRERRRGSPAGRALARLSVRLSGSNGSPRSQLGNAFGFHGHVIRSSSMAEDTADPPRVRGRRRGWWRGRRPATLEPCTPQGPLPWSGGGDSEVSASDDGLVALQLGDGVEDGAPGAPVAVEERDDAPTLPGKRVSISCSGSSSKAYRRAVVGVAACSWSN